MRAIPKPNVMGGDHFVTPPTPCGGQTVATWGGVGFKGDFRYYFSFVANGKRRFCPPRVVAVQDAPNETSNSKMPPKTQTGARIWKYQPAHLPCLDGKPPSFGARSSAGKQTNLQLLRTNNTFPLCLHTSNVDNAPP